MFLVMAHYGAHGEGECLFVIMAAAVLVAVVFGIGKERL